MLLELSVFFRAKAFLQPSHDTFELKTKICLSPGNPPSGGNPGLKRTRIGAIFKNYHMKTILKSKINLLRKTLSLKSIQ
jgi:hypothetical protein